MVTSLAPGWPGGRWDPCGGSQGPQCSPLYSHHSEAGRHTRAGTGAAVGNDDSSSDCNPPSTAAAVAAAVDNTPRGNVVAEDGKDVDFAVDCRPFSLPPPELRPPKT